MGHWCYVDPYSGRIVISVLLIYIPKGGNNGDNEQKLYMQLLLQGND